LIEGEIHPPSYRRSIESSTGQLVAPQVPNRLLHLFAFLL
jgi:hypothetical protein